MAYLDQHNSQDQFVNAVAAGGATAAILALVAAGLSFNIVRTMNINLPVVPVTPTPEVHTIPQQLTHRHTTKTVHDDHTQTILPPPGGHTDTTQQTIDTGGGDQSQQYQPPTNLAAGPVQIAGRDSFGPDDYPDAAIRAGESGATLATYTIGANGRVTSCSTNSAPSKTLATTTCRIIMQRFKFKPALNDAGNPVAQTLTQRIKWVLPAE